MINDNKLSLNPDILPLCTTAYFGTNYAPDEREREREREREGGGGGAGLRKIYICSVAMQGCSKVALQVMWYHLTTDMTVLVDILYLLEACTRVLYN